jgi:uncharacterized lipoprotein YbaY
MRFLGLVLLVWGVVAPALAQEAGGVSTPMLSRCAGRAGVAVRGTDAAFGAIALDGVPWLAIETTRDSVGTQPIATTVTGTGLLRRRNGTEVPVRFTCVLDAQGQALMFHVSLLMQRLGDTLPPATVVSGAATYRERLALPRGVELRVQLLDLAKDPAGEVLAEQVVRSGWQVPIPFALRLPKETVLDGRKLALAARMVLAHRDLFRLGEPRPVVAADLQKPVELVLDKVAPPK